MSKNYSLLPKRTRLRGFVVDVMITNHQTITSHHLFERTFFVEDIGVEPMTLCVQGRCSSQLS